MYQERGGREMKNTHCRFYEDYDEAYLMMKNYNHRLVKKDHRYLRALVDGPDNNYAVVDIDTAIELNTGYAIAW